MQPCWMFKGRIKTCLDTKGQKATSGCASPEQAVLYQETGALAQEKGKGERQGRYF